MRGLRTKFTVSVMLLLTGATGCATVGDGTVGSLTILQMALTTPVSTLETQAANNDGKAEYALGIVYEYGLHHTSKNGSEAFKLKRHAVASKGYTPITQYIPGLNGKPGRTAIINTPRYDVTVAEGRMNDACATALHNGIVSADTVMRCGGEGSYSSLRELWERAEN